MDWDALPFDEGALKRYLASLFEGDVALGEIRELHGDGEEALKEYGYGTPLLIEFQHDGQEEKVVLHTVSRDGFGHERPSDRASNLLLDHATFNRLPRHVVSLDVGAFESDRDLISLGDAGEFFFLTRYAPGRLYVRDLERIADQDKLVPRDRARCILLADYLARIHAVKHDDPLLYRRRIRDLVGHGEGIMGMLDGYPADFPAASPERLAEIERRCVTWRWRVKDAAGRLSQVHGDFHPWNVLFQDEIEFMLLDRSRGAWGEPADDVSSMSINYILFAMRQWGGVQGPFRELYDLFWARYLASSGDEGMLRVVQPFFAWRGLVLAHPVWYPSLSPEVREGLFRFVENVLDVDRFDPQAVDEYVM
jgi:hypothetical protein